MNTWKVVVAKPGKKAEIRVIPAVYESLKELVGGPVEVTEPLSEDTAVLCNEEGKLMGLPMSRIIRGDNGNPVDVYCGTIVCIGSRLENEKFDSLADIEAAIYRMMYDDPDFMYKNESEDSDD